MKFLILQSYLQRLFPTLFSHRLLGLLKFGQHFTQIAIRANGPRRLSCPSRHSSPTSSRVGPYYTSEMKTTKVTAAIDIINNPPIIGEGIGLCHFHLRRISLIIVEFFTQRLLPHLSNQSKVLPVLIYRPVLSYCQISGRGLFAKVQTRQYDGCATHGKYCRPTIIYVSIDTTLAQGSASRKLSPTCITCRPT